MYPLYVTYMGCLPVVVWCDSLSTHFSGGSEGEQPQILQLVQKMLFCTVQNQERKIMFRFCLYPQLKGKKKPQKKHESWTGGITSTLLVYVPMVSLSLFWRHWGTKTVISLWPRLQNVSTASAMPRQEKTRWWPCLQKHCWYYNVSKYNKKSFSLFLWLRRWIIISIIVLIFLYSDCRFVSCINFGQ